MMKRRTIGGFGVLLEEWAVGEAERTLLDYYWHEGPRPFILWKEEMF